MSDTLEVITPDPPVPLESVAEHRGTLPSRLWQRLALGGVMLVSIFMNFYQLGQNGFGNLYYASAIRSMLDRWKNFFFVALDPGGFVSIDKPPLGFWLQAASAKLFGFTAFSVLFALALAIRPISVITNRNNMIDSTLVLVMLLGAWAVLRAAQSGKLRWLLLCG